MGFKVSFSDVQSFDALPAGVYPVAVTEMEEKEGPNGTYFKVTLEVLDGDFANRKLWSNISLSPKAAFKLQEALIAFGEDADSLNGEFEFDPDNYIGTECCVAVSQSVYEGRTNNTVDQWLPEGSAKPIGPKNAAQSLSAATKANAKPAAGKPAAAPAGKKPTIR